MNQRRILLRTATALLVCLLILLQFRLWVSEDGYAELQRLQAEVSFQRSENARLADRNQRLDAEVQDLKRGFAALEERARSDLGLIAPGESFYVMGDSTTGVATAER